LPPPWLKTTDTNRGRSGVGKNSIRISTSMPLCPSSAHMKSMIAPQSQIQQHREMVQLPVKLLFRMDWMRLSAPLRLVKEILIP
jgi:hypothetical protein